MSMRRINAVDLDELPSDHHDLAERYFFALAENGAITPESNVYCWPAEIAEAFGDEAEGFIAYCEDNAIECILA